tara:strand:- start:31364 stop:31600 length:237 start_codon:yes stop_codon:yes gene_type:complete
MVDKDYKQIKIRVSPKEHQLLGVAAAMTGTSHTEFICNAAIEAARSLLGKDAAAVQDLVEDVRPSKASHKTSGGKGKK